MLFPSPFIHCSFTIRLRLHAVVQFICNNIHACSCTGELIFVSVAISRAPSRGGGGRHNILMPPPPLAVTRPSASAPECWRAARRGRSQRRVGAPPRRSAGVLRAVGARSAVSLALGVLAVSSVSSRPSPLAARCGSAAARRSVRRRCVQAAFGVLPCSGPWPLAVSRASAAAQRRSCTRWPRSCL